MTKKEEIAADFEKLSTELSEFLSENLETDEFRDKKRDIIRKLFSRARIKLSISYEHFNSEENPVFTTTRDLCGKEWYSFIEKYLNGRGLPSSYEEIPTFIQLLNFANFIIPISELLPVMEKETEKYSERNKKKLRSDLLSHLNRLLPRKAGVLVDSEGNVADENDIADDDDFEYRYGYILNEFEEEIRKEMEKLAMTRAKIYAE